MIQKLRLKFVAVCMALVSVVLAVVFISSYLSVRQDIADLSRQILHRVIAEESGTALRPNRPEFGINIGGNPVQLPYFTVTVWGDSAYVTSGTYSDLENTEELRDILNTCVEQSSPEGILKPYSLRYLRQDNGMYQRMAFVDMSMEQATLRRMVTSYLLIALAALALLLGVSFLLSIWVTRPVARAWRQQRQFLSDASHELKTPLTVILSNAELLAASELEERPARWAENLHSEARRMKKLVEEMLTLARADSVPATPVLTEVSLSDVAADCALAFEPVAFEAGKPLEYQLAEGVQVLGDRERLHQLISVLLDNAIKYGAEGGTVTLTLEKTEKLARVTVANPGDPIPPEQLPRLFERFYRSDDSRGEKSGFGLGLPIAGTIADEHKGTLRVESSPQETRFIFSMALKK